MGGKKSDPTPQPAVNIPSPPSLQSTIQDYVKAYPQLVDLQKQYEPQLAQLQLDLEKQFSPQYSDFMNQEQQRLTPYTYGLQEQLAKMAYENSGADPTQIGYSMVPKPLQSAYIDQLRSEVGTNAGSGIGGDYVSANLARLGEDYKSHYQNLALSLINRTPVNQPITPSFQNPVGDFGLGNAAQYNSGNYGSYVNALTNVPYYTNARGKSGMGGMIGAGIGAVGGSFFGNPMGGAALGGSVGGMF